MRYWTTGLRSRPRSDRTASRVASPASGPARTSAASPSASRGTMNTITEATRRTRTADGTRRAAYLSIESLLRESLAQVSVIEVEIVVHVVRDTVQVARDRVRVRADDQVADELLVEEEVVQRPVVGLLAR